MVYVGQTKAYSALALNAPSVYALLPGNLPAGASLPGIAAAGLLTAGVLLALFLRRQRVTGRALLAAGVVLAIGIPFLLPHMHDRYFFLADVLTLLWACTDRRRIPLAALVQIASLGAYYAYLKLEYAFPMALGALLMLAALLGAVWGLFRSLRPPADIAREIQKTPPPAQQTGARQMMLTPGSAGPAPRPPAPWPGPGTGSPCRAPPPPGCGSAPWGRGSSPPRSPRWPGPWPG